MRVRSKIPSFAVAVAIGVTMVILFFGQSWTESGGDSKLDDEHDASGSHSRTALVVEVATVARRSISEFVFADGNARAFRREFLMFESGGRVAFLRSNSDGGALREGDAVTEGELLAELDRRIDDASTRAARASLDTARAALANAQSEFDRAKQLRADQAIAESQYGAMESAWQQALASVRAAEARSDQAEAGLRQLQLRAPFDGVIAFVNIREGDYVSTGNSGITAAQSLARTSPIVVIDPSSFEILVELPVVSGRRVEIGQKAYVLDAATLAHIQEYGFSAFDGATSVNDVLVAGRVSSVSPAVDPGSRSIRTRVTTDTAVSGLSDGGYVSVWIEVDRRTNAVTAPIESIILRGETAYAFVVDRETNLVEQRTLTLGLTGEEGVEVLSGLNEGERVVTSGRYRLADGMRVRAVATRGDMQ